MKNYYPKDSVLYLIHEILTQYLRGTKQAIEISEIRCKLAEIYDSSGLFDLNMPGDATEVFIEILQCFHKEESLLPEGCQDKCISHSLFAISAKEIYTCKCGKVKVVDWDKDTFAHHVYVSEMFIESNLTREVVQSVNFENIEEYLHLCSVVDCQNRFIEGVRYECTMNIEHCFVNENCMIKMSEKNTELIKAPENYVFSLIWDNSHPSRIKLLQFLCMIKKSLNLKDIFSCNRNLLYYLFSFIAFGMGHYVAIVYKNRKWYCIDDIKVSIIGNYYDLAVHLLKSRYYPVSLYYSQEEIFHEELDINEMIKLEYHIAEIDSDPLSSKISNPSENWTCSCKFINSTNPNFCDSCRNLKPGVEGWICGFCTFFNSDNLLLECEICKNNRSHTPSSNSKNFDRTYSKKSFNSKERGIISKSSTSKSFKCKLCRTILESKHQNKCANCLIKTNSQNCPLCSKKVTKDYCSNCIYLVSHCKTCLNFHIEGADC